MPTHCPIATHAYPASASQPSSSSLVTLLANGILLDDCDSMESAKGVRTRLLFSYSVNLSGPAPGFQTNVRKIRVPPELMARIRRGEDVSPDEIAAASARMDAEEREGSTTPGPLPQSKKTEQPKPVAKDTPSEPVNEWLPEGITGPKKRSKGKKK